MRAAEILIVNRSVWEDLPAEDHDLLRQAAADAVPFQRQVERTGRRRHAEAARCRVTITKIGDITPWRRATQSVIERYGERYSEYLDRIDALRQSNQP